MGPGSSSETTGIWTVSILGGSPRKIRENSGRAAVSPDGAHIAFISGKTEAELWFMGANGENARKLVDAGNNARFLQLQWSPDGRRVAFMKSRTEAGKYEVSIESRPLSQPATTLILSHPRLYSFFWTADNHLIYSLQEPPPNEKDTNLWKLVLDPRSGKPAGEPERITSWAGFSFWDLSATSDGKRLAFVKAGSQSDVYSADLELKGRLISPPQRITLDERNDLPSAWMPDNETILFHSDRSGSWHIFKQPIKQRTAEEFISGVEEQMQPWLSPDGALVLYWAFTRNNAQIPQSMRLLRMPLPSGAPETVLESNWGAHFRCSSSSKSLCVLGEEQGGQKDIVFSAFNPLRGRSHELARVERGPAGLLAWDLSPDGSALAVLLKSEPRSVIRVFDLRTHHRRDVQLQLIGASGLAWSSDGHGWFLTVLSLKGSALLRVGPKGDAYELWKTNSLLGTPVPSPDGKHLALSVSSQNSNAWVIENF